MITEELHAGAEAVRSQIELLTISLQGRWPNTAQGLQVVGVFQMKISKYILHYLLTTVSTGSYIIVKEHLLTPITIGPKG